MNQQMICSNCGHIGSAKGAVKGSMGIEIVLWLFFIIPGVIYSLWRGSSRHKVCSVCASGNLIPIDSPNGRRLLEAQGKTIEKVQAEAKATPMAGSTKLLLWVGGIIGGIFLIAVFSV